MKGRPPPPGGASGSEAAWLPPSVGKLNRWRPLALESLCFSGKGLGPRAGGDPLEGLGREQGCVLPGTRGPSPRPQSPREARGEARTSERGESNEAASQGRWEPSLSKSTLHTRLGTRSLGNDSWWLMQLRER